MNVTPLAGLKDGTTVRIADANSLSDGRTGVIVRRDHGVGGVGGGGAVWLDFDGEVVAVSRYTLAVAL